MGEAVEVLVLRCEGPRDRPGFVSAVVLPFRGFMLYQARAFSPGIGEFDLLHAPPLEAGLQRLLSGREDVGGAQSVNQGGAFLAPFANRLRGRPGPDGRTIKAEIYGETVDLPANRTGACLEACAIHGLILAAPAQTVRLEGTGRAIGRIPPEAFAGGWPSRLQTEIAVDLAPERLTVTIVVSNVGERASPVGLGWHPYLKIPSGERSQARLRLRARRRLRLSSYEEVFPTGECEAVEGSRFDFTGGAPLGEAFLDDCFTGLEPAGDGVAVAELVDPAAGLTFRLRADVPPVKAVQVYAPLGQSFVAIEPQFNLIDPFGPQWRGGDAGMVRLEPGGRTQYRSSLEIAAVGGVPDVPRA